MICPIIKNTSRPQKLTPVRVFYVRNDVEYLVCIALASRMPTKHNGAVLSNISSCALYDEDDIVTAIINMPKLFYTLPKGQDGWKIRKRTTANCKFIG